MFLWWLFRTANLISESLSSQQYSHCDYGRLQQVEAKPSPKETLNAAVVALNRQSNLSAPFPISPDVLNTAGVKALSPPVLLETFSLLLVLMTHIHLRVTLFPVNGGFWIENPDINESLL